MDRVRSVSYAKSTVPSDIYQLDRSTQVQGSPTAAMATAENAQLEPGQGRFQIAMHPEILINNLPIPR
jgi:hypothetical protein